MASGPDADGVEPQERASGAGALARSRKRWRAEPLASGPARPSDAPAPRAGAEEEDKTNEDQLSEDLKEVWQAEEEERKRMEEDGQERTVISVDPVEDQEDVDGEELEVVGGGPGQGNDGASDFAQRFREKYTQRFGTAGEK